MYMCIYIDIYIYIHIYIYIYIYTHEYKYQYKHKYESKYVIIKMWGVENRPWEAYFRACDRWLGLGGPLWFPSRLDCASILIQDDWSNGHVAMFFCTRCPCLGLSEKNGKNPPIGMDCHELSWMIIISAFNLPFEGIFHSQIAICTVSLVFFLLDLANCFRSHRRLSYEPYGNICTLVICFLKIRFSI